MAFSELTVSPQKYLDTGEMVIFLEVQNGQVSAVPYVSA